MTKIDSTMLDPSLDTKVRRRLELAEIIAYELSDKGIVDIDDVVSHAWDDYDMWGAWVDNILKGRTSLQAQIDFDIVEFEDDVDYWINKYSIYIDDLGMSTDLKSYS